MNEIQITALILSCITTIIATIRYRNLSSRYNTLQDAITIAEGKLQSAELKVGRHERMITMLKEIGEHEKLAKTVRLIILNDSMDVCSERHLKTPVKLEQVTLTNLGGIDAYSYITTQYNFTKNCFANVEFYRIVD